MKTHTSDIQQTLVDAGVDFILENGDPLHPRRWVSYLDGEEITAKATLGQCIWATAQQLGEAE